MNAKNNSQPRPPRGVNLEKMRPCDECGELDYVQPFKAKKGKKVYHLCRLCIWDYRLIDENVKVEIVDTTKEQ